MDRSENLAAVLSLIEGGVSYLREKGYRVKQKRIIYDDICGDIGRIEYEKSGIRAVFNFRPGSRSRKPFLSVLIESGNKSFTLTDYRHHIGDFENNNNEENDEINDVNFVNREISYFNNACRGRLGSILSGSSWIEIPTYRGINE